MAPHVEVAAVVVAVAVVAVVGVGKIETVHVSSALAEQVRQRQTSASMYQVLLQLQRVVSVSSSV